MSGIRSAAKAALCAARVYPSGLRDVVDPERAGALPTYWGDVN
jgi:hypothetical protein